MTDQEGRPANDISPATTSSGNVLSLEQFLVHGLNCTAPECLLPLCVNTKLMFKHAQSCTSTNCSFCDKTKNLIPKHSESCVDNFCSIPFCLETKLKKFLESEVDKSKGSDATVQKQQDKQTITVDGEISNAVTKGTTLADSEYPPQMAQSMTEASKGCYGSVSRQTESGPNQPGSAKESSSSLKQPSADSLPPRTPKRSSNRSCSRAKVTQPTKLPRLSLIQNRYQTLTEERSLGCFKMEPISTKHGSCSKTAIIQSVTAPPHAEWETGTENAQGLKEFASVFNLYDEKALNHRIEENKKLQELINEPYEEDSLLACRAVGPNLNTSLERDSKPNSTKRGLLKVRFFHALFSLMRLIKKTERRREFLICVGSLRSAIHEIKHFDQAFTM